MSFESHSDLKAIFNLAALRYQLVFKFAESL